MRPVNRRTFTLALAAATAIALGLKSLPAQDQPDPNSAPNPYRMVDSVIQLPEGRKLGSPIGVEIDHSDGKTLWVFDRCGGDTCVGSNLAPIMKFDASGKMVANFGAGTVNWPHGFYVDRNGDVWVTDGQAGGGRGHTVIKFAPDGKILMTLGKPGVAGDAPGMFNAPSDVVTAPNGDIFVADGHGILQGQLTNDRIVKLSKDGTNPGFKQGIRIGSVKDGKVTAFIPLTDPAIGSAEELTADDQGNVYAGFTAAGKMAVRRFVKN